MHYYRENKIYELIIHTFILENNGPHTTKCYQGKCVLESETWSKSNLHSIYKTQPTRILVVVPLSGKTCPRQLSRIIAMDSTKSQNKIFTSVLTFISTLLYMKLVINVMQLQNILRVLYLYSRFIIFH